MTGETDIRCLFMLTGLCVAEVAVSTLPSLLVVGGWVGGWVGVFVREASWCVCM